MDRRNSIHKYPQVIKGLREVGFKDGDLIPLDYVVREIYSVFGCDGRTVKKHLNRLVELNFLDPKGPPRREKSDVTVRKPQTGGVSIIEYWSKKGFSHYVFGLQAPRTFQATLNLEYVSPRTPLKKGCEGEGQKNVCVPDGGLEVNGSSSVEDDLRAVKYLEWLEANIKKEKKEEERLCDTHIFITPLNEENGKNGEKVSVQEKNRNSQLNLYLNSLPKPLPKPDSLPKPSLPKPNSLPKLKKCPKCGRRGSLHRKVIRVKGRTYSYLYFAHYDHGKVSWCYIPRKMLEELDHG